MHNKVRLRPILSASLQKIGVHITMDIGGMTVKYEASSMVKPYSDINFGIAGEENANRHPEENADIDAENKAG